MPIWTVAVEATEESLLCPLPAHGFTIGGGFHVSLDGLEVTGEYVVAGSMASPIGALCGAFGEKEEYDCLRICEGDVSEGGWVGSGYEGSDGI